MLNNEAKRRGAFIFQGSPLPASITSRCRVALKCWWAEDNPVALRWPCRIRAGEVHDERSKNGFSPIIITKPRTYLGFDVVQGETLSAWIEIPGSRVGDGDGDGEDIRSIVRRDVESFDKVKLLGDSGEVVLNSSWKRAQVPLVMAIHTAWDAIRENALPGMGEMAALLGISATVMLETRKSVLLLDKSPEAWYVVDMPQVAAYMIQGVRDEGVREGGKGPKNAEVFSSTSASGEVAVAT